MNNISCIQWAISTLNDNEYDVLVATPEIIQDKPWSTVYRFKTRKGFVFLKIVPKVLFVEAKIINILRNQFSAPIPFMIAQNPDQHCFLMKDAGIKLNDFFKVKFQADILIDIIRHYSELQMDTSTKIKLFLETGIPDWRLSKLTLLYEELLTNDNLLIEDGLTSQDLLKLKKLTPKLNEICDKLSSYKINETFGHADFHDRNILINPDTMQTTIIDLGEVVITHPFFSLHNCLYMARENFSLSEQQFQQLQSEALKSWLVMETKDHLYEIINLIQQCWSIHAVLGEFRLLNSVDPSTFPALQRQGRLSKKLQYWINQK